jgi:hypothetical protein
VVKEIKTTVRNYAGNLLKIKARLVPSKRPVQNWYSKGIMMTFELSGFGIRFSVINAYYLGFLAR